MATVDLTSGILAGTTLEVWDAEQLGYAADSIHRDRLEKVSFYRGELRRKTFRGVTFQSCSFARTTFRSISFRKCAFNNVDMIRTVFVDCTFSECDFLNCDPYNARFTRCAVDPAYFKKCYQDDNVYNKALILFSTLRQSLEREGNGRMARTAEYYYRIWERRRLYHLWRTKETSGFWPWCRSFLVAILTGYGERPVYIGGWILALITFMGFVYQRWFPAAIGAKQANFADYWFFSFRLFCTQGLTSTFAGRGVVACEVLEVAIGLVLIALLLGSVTRKLSS